MAQHFCFAKVLACGRVTERERGNPLRFPPSHSPFLAIGRGEGTKPVGNHTKAPEAYAFRGFFSP